MRSVIILWFLLLAATPASYAAQPAPPVIPVTPAASWQPAFLRPDCTPTPTPPPNGAALGQPVLRYVSSGHWQEDGQWLTAFYYTLSAGAAEQPGLRFWVDTGRIHDVHGWSNWQRGADGYVDLLPEAMPDLCSKGFALIFYGEIDEEWVRWSWTGSATTSTIWGGAPSTAHVAPTPSFRVFLPLVLR